MDRIERSLAKVAPGRSSSTGLLHGELCRPQLLYHFKSSSCLSGYQICCVLHRGLRAMHLMPESVGMAALPRVVNKQVGLVSLIGLIDK